jgi:NAD+ kinase
VRVILVKKQSTWEQYLLNPDQFGKLSPVSRLRMEGSHERHMRIVNLTLTVLHELKVKPWVVEGAGQRFKAGHGDLVITVGGDGTVLSASHNIGPKAFLFAINSDPVFSKGRFCQVFEKKHLLSKALQKALSDNRKVTLIPRMSVTVGKQVVSRRVLNEALFSHTCPAAMTRIAPPGKIRYACSGLWVGTGAGSTGAIRSSGGKVLPLLSKQLQTVLREVCSETETGSLVWLGDKFTFTSLTTDATLYLDGPFLRVPVGFEQVMRFELSDEPLGMVSTVQK